MPELESVTQEFQAQATEYLATLDVMIAKAIEWATAVTAAVDEVADQFAGLGVEIVGLNEDLDAGANRATDLAAALAKAGGGAQAASAGMDSARNAATGLAAADEAAAESINYLARIADYLNATFGIVVESEDLVMAKSAQLFAMNQSLAESFGNVRSQAAVTALSEADLAAMNEKLAASFGPVVAETRLETELTQTLAETDLMAAAAQQVLADSSRTLGEAWALDAAAASVLGAATTQVATATNNAAAAAQRTYTWWGLTGTQIHWIISGSVELLAVLGPATVAAGAWAFAWVQGATNVYDHLTSLYTATEALGQASGKTFGEMLGLSGEWQKIQNEANPDVYQVLGAAVNLLKESFGNLAQVGLQIGEVFDTFAARVVADFQKGGEAANTMGELLAHMEPDLVNVGRFFGDIGAAIASFASQMPGLAEVLLSIVTGLADMLKFVVELAGQFRVFGATILTVFMAFEEFNRWGGLVVTVMDNMGLASSTLATGILSPARAIGILQNVLGLLPMAITRVGDGIAALGAKLPVLGEEVTGAGEAMAGFGVDSSLAVAGLSGPWVLGIAAAAVGLGILVDKLVTTRTAAQQLTDSLQDATEKASNFDVFETAAKAVDTLQGAISQNDQQVTQSTAHLNDASDAASRYTGQVNIAATQVRNAEGANATYAAGIAQQGRDMANVVQGADTISKAYGVSIPEAMALADNANVSLTKSLKNANGTWTTAGEQVRDYMQGMEDMGVPMGAIGNDMLALAINTGETASKMQTLNSAWDTFMTDITGGTGGLAGFVTSMQNIGSVAATTADNLATSTGSMSLSTAQFAQALTSMNSTGAAAWTNFDQVVGSTAPQLIDWFRTASTMGAVTGKQVQQAGLDMISALIPLAAKSTTAQAELLTLAKNAGLNVTTFPQLEAAVKNSNASISNLNGLTDTATINMSNMAIDAQNLGDVMNTTVVNAIVSASLKTSGFNTDIQNMLQAQETNKTVGGKTWQQWEQLAAEAMANAQNAAGKAASGINKDLADIPNLTTKVVNVVVDYSSTGSASAYVQGEEGHAVKGAGGGYVHGPGTATSDSIAARLSRGEYVMQASAVEHYGRSLFDALNARRYAEGGPVASGVTSSVLEATVAGGGPFVVNATHNHQISVGGVSLGNAVRRESLVYTRRNPRNNLSLRAR